MAAEDWGKGYRSSDCQGNSGRAPRIGVVTIPIEPSGLTPLRHLIDILYELSGKLVLVSADAGYDDFVNDPRVLRSGFKRRKGRSLAVRAFGKAFSHLRLTTNLVRQSGRTDVWILFIGGETLILPMIAAKLCRKKVVILFSGSMTLAHRATGRRTANLTGILADLNCCLADHLIVYSSRLIGEWGLQKFNHKIIVAHRHFVDLAEFEIARDLTTRENIVGYVGRLSKEKGVPNLVESMTMLDDSSVRLMLVGDGPMRKSIDDFVGSTELAGRVLVTGWRHHREIPGLLRQMKVIVVPSHTEGLPNVIIEAMAAGTPVLTTDVGATADIVKDGRTGFILKDNSPGAIVFGINRVFESPNIEQITTDARKLVENEFVRQRVVSHWKHVLHEITSCE